MLPVIILTGVDDDYLEVQDLNHDADEDAVLEKPLDIGEFPNTIRTFDGFEIAITRTDN